MRTSPPIEELNISLLKSREDSGHLKVWPTHHKNGVPATNHVCGNVISTEHSTHSRLAFAATGELIRVNVIRRKRARVGFEHQTPGLKGVNANHSAKLEKLEHRISRLEVL